jgi:hypothetical protein
VVPPQEGRLEEQDEDERARRRPLGPTPARRGWLLIPEPELLEGAGLISRGRVWCAIASEAPAHRPAWVREEEALRCIAAGRVIEVTD